MIIDALLQFSDAQDIKSGGASTNVVDLGQPNPDPRYAALEREILEKINATGVGPQGLGGDVTSLAVHIDFHPCHIASMPVALNLNCHAARHAEVTL